MLTLQYWRIMLTEEQIRKIIAETPKLVVKVYDDNCPFCTQYEPIFDEVAKQYSNITFAAIKIPRNQPSEFRAEFMTVDGKEKNSVPATLIFEGGKLVAQGWGRMFEPELKEFIETGKQPQRQPNPVEWAAKASTLELEAQLWQHTKQIEKLAYVKNIFEAEWNKRMAAKGM